MAERMALADTLEAELAALPPSDERSLIECDSHLQRAMWALDVPRLDEAERLFALARADLDRLDPEFARTHPDLPSYRQDIEFWDAWLDVLRGRVDAGLERRSPSPGRRATCASSRPA